MVLVFFSICVTSIYIIRSMYGILADNKGTGSPDGLRYFLYLRTDVGINKRADVFEYLKCLQRLAIEINLFLPVNVNISWLIMLVALLR
jgi:hypothetical protein